MIEVPKYVHWRKDRKKWRAQRWDVKKQKVINIGHYDTMEEAAYAQLVGDSGHPWVGMPEDAEEQYFGFTYEMEHLPTGRKYIGQKQFLFWDSVQGGYKITNRDSEDFDRSLWKVSDWRDYCSSSKVVQRIANKKPWDFEYRVIGLHKSKLGMHLAEIQSQVDAKVLTKTDRKGRYVYINDHIAGCEYRPQAPIQKLRRAKIKALNDVEAYHMRPKICEVCGEVIPYGETQCINKPLFGNGSCGG